MEYYFDIETYGLPEKTNKKFKVISIQYQLLPYGTLHILKEWENGYNEERILSEIRPLLSCYVFDAVLIGKCLLEYDLPIICNRLKFYDPKYKGFPERIVLDLKTTLILINNGIFKGWNKIIPCTNTISNNELQWFYDNKEFDKIEQYIKAETKDFINGYLQLKSILSTIKLN